MYTSSLFANEWLLLLTGLVIGIPFLPLAMMGISGLAGALGNRGQTQQQNSLTQRNAGSSFKTAQGRDASQTHILQPGAKALIDQITGGYMNLMQNDPNLSGYASSGIQDINRVYDLQREATNENMAARGFRGPIIGAANNANDARRFSEVARFRNQIPLLQRELQQQTMDRALQAFSAQPVDIMSSEFSGNEGYSNEFSNEASQGTGTTPGNMLGGGLGNLGNMLAFLFGQGAIGGGGGGGSAQNFNFDPTQRHG
jgi:hypothetical protein